MTVPGYVQPYLLCVTKPLTSLITLEKSVQTVLRLEQRYFVSFLKLLSLYLKRKGYPINKFRGTTVYTAHGKVVLAKYTKTKYLSSDSSMSTKSSQAIIQ